MSRSQKETPLEVPVIAADVASDDWGTLGSGNVFADLGLEQPEGELVKADLVIAVSTLIQQRGLTQTAAAQVLETTQPKLSRLLRGLTEGVSVTKLMDYLRRLSHDVTITITPVAEPRSVGHVRVVRLENSAGEGGGRQPRHDRQGTVREVGRKVGGRIPHRDDEEWGMGIAARYAGAAKSARKSARKSAKKSGGTKSAKRAGGTAERWVAQRGGRIDESASRPDDQSTSHQSAKRAKGDRSSMRKAPTGKATGVKSAGGKSVKPLSSSKRSSARRSGASRSRS